MCPAQQPPPDPATGPGTGGADNDPATGPGGADNDPGSGGGRGGAASDPATGREVLSGADIQRALTRIAHELLESNKGPDDLVLIGIPTRGVHLAARLGEALRRVEGAEVPVGSLDVTMYRDDLRSQPTRPVEHTSVPGGGIDDKVVVLVDDVLYSGRTVRAALDALADYGRPRTVRLAVLVDRGHRALPIRADHVGKNLPTAHAERVDVRLAEIDQRDGVWISQRGGSDMDTAAASTSATPAASTSTSAAPSADDEGERTR